MPKMPKVEVHLRRINFIKKKQGMLLHLLTDFWFCMLKIPGVYNKDGAKPQFLSAAGGLGILAHSCLPRFLAV